MSNIDNIKPYADFAHEAAKHGGVDSYLSEIAEANQELGILKEKKSEGWKGALLLGTGIIIWECGKAAIHRIKALHTKKADEVAELSRKSEEATAAIVKEVQEALSEEESASDALLKELIVESSNDLTINKEE